MTRWQLQDAKARLSELVKKATTEGPQEITVHGKPAVVVLSQAEFENLTARKTGAKETPNLVDFLLNSPLRELDLEFERDKSLCRDEPIFDEDEWAT